MSESSPAGEPVSSTDKPDKDSSVECPTCGRTDFKSDRGMKSHHAKIHGESIAGFTYPCEECGSDVKYKQRREGCEHFCSKECESDYREKNGRLIGVDGEDHPSAKGEVIECDICGVEFYCKASQLERRRFCSQSCLAKHNSNRTGRDHHRWKEGAGRENYAGVWWANRKQALERDDYECQICGRGEEELGRNPDVHHIIPVHEFDELSEMHAVENLITLCRQHHDKWEGLYLQPDIRD